MKKYFFILFAVFYIITIPVYGQSRIKIFGVVKNEKNMPLTGARILLKKTGSTSECDVNGWFGMLFRIQQDTVQVTYPEYKTALIPINKTTKFPIHIIMYKK